MNISYNWLKNYIETDKTAIEVATILTSLGLETGGVRLFEPVKGGLKGLITGEVLTCEKHPNADKLSLTTVDIGSGVPLSIVCGAPNVRAGQKVVVAPVGTTLYGKEGAFTIKQTKIRGALSEGMICSEDEIGLGVNHDGIIELSQAARAGEPVSGYFEAGSDEIIEVDITPNRVDSASHLGVARDLAAWLNVNGVATGVKWPSVEHFTQDNNSFPVKVTIEDNDGCTRYSGVTISGIKVGESPAWLKEKLTAIGMVPVNNVVDVTNFVLHECGQPLHAFDGKQVSGNHVIIKTMQPGTSFVTLDGKARVLNDKDLMICNQEEPMCMAGIYGGLKSGVTRDTTAIFLESACFSPVYIRQSSRRHGLFTDASFRFERGSDPGVTIYALKRAALLIKEIAGGEISSAIIDIYPNPVPHSLVYLAWSNLWRLTGEELAKATVKKILASLEIKIESETQEGLNLAVPPYRVDVKREVDVIEEILRIYGFNNIKIPSKVNSTITFSSNPDKEKFIRLTTTRLTGAGFTEIINNSLTKAAYYEGSKQYPGEKTILIANPLSNDLNALRQTLLFGGLETIRHNRNRQNRDLMLFEIGNCYALNQAGQPQDLGRYNEYETLALFITGSACPENWATGSRASAFADIKDHCCNILNIAGLKDGSWQTSHLEPDLMSAGLEFHDNGSKLFTLGIVSQRVLNQFDIDQPVFFAETSVAELIAIAGKQKIRYSELPKFPEVRRDLSLTIDKSVRFEEIEKVATNAVKKNLKRITLFDIYEGDKIGKDKKSYAVSFFLEDKTKTLNDTEIAALMDKIVNNLETRLGAKLRD